jgi:hypothetical protein
MAPCSDGGSVSRSFQAGHDLPERLYARIMVEPRERGEPGYGDWCIHLFEMGICSCDGCGGHVVDGTCLSCGCGHGIHEPSRFNRQRYAAWTRVAEPGRCSHADRVRAEEERERQRQARKRRAAEELGDPQR